MLSIFIAGANVRLLPNEKGSKIFTQNSPLCNRDGRRWLVARLKLVAAGIGDLGLG
jgi:hypothetical protein